MNKFSDVPINTADISKAIESLYRGCKFAEKEHQLFTPDDLHNATAVFFHIASNLAFDFHNRYDVPFDEMCDKNEAFGAYLREMLIQHTGIDMADFRGNPLSAEIVEEIDDDAN
jgi:hypothetical protein